LVYEGEQEGAASVAETLIEEAVLTLFEQYFPKISKLEHPDAVSPYAQVLDFFFEESGFELLDELPEAEYKAQLDNVGPLDDLINKYQPDTVAEDKYFLKEFILWGLVGNDKLSKDRFTEGYQFKDILGSYLNEL